MPVRKALPTFPVSKSGGRWTSLFIFENREGQWITGTGAGRRWRKTPAARQYLQTRLRAATAKRTRVLHGKKVRHIYVEPPIPRRSPQVCVYFLPHAQAIAEGESLPPGEAYEDGQGRWITRWQLREWYKVNPDTFVSYWCKRPSRLRPGERALRQKLIPNLANPHGPASTRGLFEEDVKVILRGEESKSRTSGQRAHSLPDTLGDAAVKVWLRELLAPAPMLRLDVVALARKKGIGLPRLRKLATSMGISWNRRSGRGGDWWWCLPGQKPPPNTAIYEDVARLLRSLLAGGPLRAAEVVRRARQAGVKPVRLYTAKKALGIIRTEGAGAATLWHLLSPPRSAESRSEPAASRRGGRPPSPRTEAVYRACFEQYTSRKKVSQGLVEVQRLFPKKAPKDESHLRLYARRYAARHGLPCDRPV
jgi:hypothetical protein